MSTLPKPLSKYSCNGKEKLMKRVLLPMALLLGGGIAGLLAGLLLPAEQREQLSRQLAALIGGMAEHCPDG
jgi:hypothetical protein